MELLLPATMFALDYFAFFQNVCVLCYVQSKIAVVRSQSSDFARNPVPQTSSLSKASVSGLN